MSDAFNDAQALSGSLAADLPRLGRAGLWGLAVFAGLFGAWASLAPLSYAVTATGSFVVETQLRKVQHPTGGLVLDVLANEGESVEAGSVIVRLDDRVQQASQLALQHQRIALEARLSRLEAERDGHGLPELRLAAASTDDVWQAIVSAERTLLAARRQAHEGQRRQLQLRIEQAEDEIEGLQVQLHSKLREAELLELEMAGVAGLVKRKLVPLPRLTQLQRTQASLNGERQDLEAQIARVRAKIAELQLQVAQVSQTSHSEASEQMRDVQARLAETMERIRTTDQQVESMAVRAPVSGVIHSMTAARPGTHVAAGEAVFEIVPDGETLHLDAKIAVRDYSAVALGQKTLIRLHAFNPRTVPELVGTVTRMDPNSRKDPATDRQVFTIRVSVSPDELSRLGKLRLRAGMAADVVIPTTASSPRDKLAMLLGDLASRAFRER